LICSFLEQSVSIGWGKKETQFHGSAGKQAALIPSQPTSASLSDQDDYKPRISWRGDGQFFVCSSVDPNGGNVQLLLLMLFVILNDV